MPLSIPAVIFGVGFLYAYTRGPLVLYGSNWVIVLVYVTLMVPFSARMQLSGMVALGDSYQEASRVSGGGVLRTHLRIMAPLMRATFAGTAALMFILLANEFAASLLVRSPTQNVMGTVLYNYYGNGLYPAGRGHCARDGRRHRGGRGDRDAGRRLRHLQEALVMDALEGKVAVVTGAASGIGYALCEAFAAEGMRIAMADVDPAGLDAAAARLAADAGAEVLAVPTDVMNWDEVAALEARVVDRFGAVHVLCNNAGVQLPGVTWEFTRTEWEWVLGVNLGGVVHGSRGVRSPGWSSAASRDTS